MYVCMHACIPVHMLHVCMGAYRDQKRAPDPSELVLPVVVNCQWIWVLGTELSPFERKPELLARGYFFSTKNHFLASLFHFPIMSSH